MKRNRLMAAESERLLENFYENLDTKSYDLCYKLR